MTDDLTRVIAEAVALPGCGCLSSADRWAADPDNGDPYGCYCECDPDYDPCDHDKSERIAAALAPLIEARVLEARAGALTDAADAWTQGAWASTPRHKDRVADRMAASQYAGDWLRERAEEARR